MIVWLIVLLAVIIIGFLPVNVKITYLKYKGSNKLKVKTGIVTCFFTVYDSSKKKTGKSSGKLKKKSDIPDEGKKRKINAELIGDFIKEATDLFSYFGKKLHIIFLKLHFHIGFDDAAQTGIVTGALWGTLYSCVSLINNTFNLKEHTVHVAPDFMEVVFETDIEIKLRIKIINLIVFAGKTYKSIKKLNFI